MVIEKQRTGPRDVFFHLLSIVTLYASATSFVSLVFTYVDLVFPDALGADYYTKIAAYSSIRWWISILIVVFPVHILMMWYLSRSYVAMPKKRNLRIRKWLIYFTLFAAALFIIGDLVALINNLLNGELTVRFLLKVLVVFFVAGAIFFYDFWDLKKYKTE